VYIYVCMCIHVDIAICFRGEFVTIHLYIPSLLCVVVDLLALFSPLLSGVGCDHYILVSRPFKAL